jgi:hypothetical protein
LSLLVVLPLAGCAQKESTMVREPVVANQFYPGNKDALSRMLDEMLRAAPAAKTAAPIVGIAVPHAGYPYSGPTAAYAYRAIAGSGIKTVVMIGPSHHALFSGFAVYAKGAWKTPLGKTDIDEALAAEIIKQNKIIRDLPQAHAQEHSLEVQLPFLQKVMGTSLQGVSPFKIVPIELGEASYGDLETLARALVKACKGRSVLLLASSDLYHGDSYPDCKRSDSVTLSDIERLDASALYSDLARGTAAACGGLPITAMMLALKEMGADHAELLHRTNSNDVTGERGGYCVGYAAVAFYGAGAAGPKEKESAARSAALLAGEEQAELLRIARATVEAAVRGNEIPKVSPASARLNEPRGVFVTLHEHGELRGCIGLIEGIKPVAQAVREMAVAAATEDYRFPPVKPAELDKIDIEITVLTPLERTSEPLEDIELGRHGIVVKQGPRQGVFLPQVATETGWDKETFLSQCCAGKAGLPPDAWKSRDCEVYIFEGQIFGEKE